MRFFLAALLVAVAACGHGAGSGLHDVGQPDGGACLSSGFCLSAPIPAPGGTAIYAAGSNDVWAGDRLLTHWDGSKWSIDERVPGTFIGSLSGVSSAEVWATYGASVYRFDGASWALAFTPASGSGPVTVSAVAHDAAWLWNDTDLYRWDGKSWASAMAGLPAAPFWVWGSAANDAWCVGNQLLAHWNGTGWTRVTIPGASMGPLWGTSAHDIWSAGSPTMHYDGTSWTKAAALGDTVSVSGTSTTDVWFGTSAGLLHWDGSVAKPVAFPLTSANSIAAVAPNDVWATSAAGTPYAHWNGAEWKPYGSSADGQSTNAFWQVSANDVWATMNDGTAREHFDGTGWSLVPDNGSGTAFWASASNDVWEGTFEGLEHWDGTAWSWSSVHDASSRVDQLCGTAANDVWALITGSSSQAALWRWNGSAWAVVDPQNPDPYSSLRGLACASGGQVFLTADGSKLGHFDGASWTWTAAWPKGCGPTALAASSASDVWMACSTQVGRWDGSAFLDLTSAMALPSAVTAVRSFGPQALYLGLDDPHAGLYRWDGAALTSESSVGGSAPHDAPLLVSGPSESDLWVSSYVGLWHRKR